MDSFLGLLPILVTVAALLAGLRSIHAALLGVAAAGIAMALAFPLPAGALAPALYHWLPVLAEVLMIIAGGLLLSEVLRQAGAQAALAQWISARAGTGTGAVLLVVHGVTPFAESVTGFGVGITIGIPLLAQFGLSAGRVAAIGLLGLCAVPWGSMGPGTLIAARMSGLPFHDLGVASGVVSVVPFVVTGVVAARLAAPRGDRLRSMAMGAVSGLMLMVAVIAANAVFGTAPAGAVGALAVIVVHLLRRPGLWPDALGRRALAGYAILLGGVLVMATLLRALGAYEDWHYAASPALWLFVAVLWFAHAQSRAQGHWRLPLRSAIRPALRPVAAAWLHVAPVTALFILLGVVMAETGMAAHLARALSGLGALYLPLAPFVGAMGGFVTGSNAGANAMFAATQAEIARALGVDLLWFMAIHNVAAAFLLMASPGKIEMALQLAPPGAIEARRRVQTTILGTALVVTTVLAAASLMLG